MKPTRVGDNWARFDDNTTWALPSEDDDECATVERIQRYGSIEDLVKQRMTVAFMLDCYAALIMLPQRKRNARVKAIREAMAVRAAKRKESAT